MQLETKYESTKKTPVTSQIPPAGEVTYETRKLAKVSNHGQVVQQKFRHLICYFGFSTKEYFLFHFIVKYSKAPLDTR
jgi:hypothetical protein